MVVYSKKMNFKDTNIRGLFDNSIQYSIPVYQRAYSWQEENWCAFISDLFEQVGRDNEYSYGNLLLETIESEYSYEVIDGQQRLTTIIIFMRSLYNALKEKGECKDTLEEITEFFFQRKSKYRLRTVDNDRACFDAVIIADSVYTASSESQENIINAKDYFSKAISKSTLVELQQLYKLVLKSKINRIELEGKKEAALMFELQNNRGRDLTNMEKLKSFFMYQMYVNSPTEETLGNVECISNYFKEIYTSVYAIKGISEDNILIYHCNAYLHVAYNYKNLDDIKKELSEQQDKIEWMKIFSRELALTFANLKRLQLTCHSTYYQKLQRIRKHDGFAYFIYPFIIKGYKYLQNDTVKLDKLFRILETLAFRYHLVSSRADIGSRLSEIIRNFDGNLWEFKHSLETKLNSEYHWSYNKMRDVLSGYMYGNSALHYLLWEYEEHIQPKGYKIVNIEIDNEQIEHISPQTPTDGKPLESGYEVNDQNQYTEEFIKTYLNSIGNLMLIAGSHNASIGNVKFQEKLESYKKTPLKQQSEIKYFLVDSIPEWKHVQIEARKQKILSFAFKRWDLNDIDIQNDNALF